MKHLLQLEEAALFLLSIFLFRQLPFAWCWFPTFLLVPDISMIGYLINTKTGAFTYNFLHHRATATLVAFYALMENNAYWQFAAIILFAHISFDRLMGYGLKYTDSFGHTHLGEIGKKEKHTA